MSSMHPIAPEEIMALLDGELSADRTRSLSLHVGECPECRQIRESLTGTSQSLSGWTVPMARTGQTFENCLAAAALSFTSKSSSFRNVVLPRVGWKLATWAAAVVLGLGGWIALTSRSAKLAPSAKSINVALGPRNQLSINEPNASVDQARTDWAHDAAKPAMAGKLGATIGALKESNGYRGWLKNGDIAREEQEGIALPRTHSRSELAQAPMIARTAWLSVVVKDFPAARVSLDAILQRQRGYAASLTASTELNAPRSLQASLRIPAAELSATLAELKSLGRVENETQSGDEVTQQHADLIARLKNSRQTEQRLQAILLQRTGKISDVLAVEQEIARVRGEIERMEAEQKSLEHRVEFAALDLRLAEEYQAQLTAPSPSLSIRLRNAVVKGYRSGFETAVGIVLFILEVGPSLLLWLIIFSPVGWFLRRRWLRAQTLAS